MSIFSEQTFFTELFEAIFHPFFILFPFSLCTIIIFSISVLQEFFRNYANT